MMSEFPLMPRRRVRLCYFNTWAGALEDSRGYLRHVAEMDLAPLVSKSNDLQLLRKARLDCDWYAENVRCFAAIKHPAIEFLPAWVVGTAGILDVASTPREAGEERWLVTMAHQPQALGNLAPKIFAFLSKTGVRHAYYAFDEASRSMPCFAEIAPYLDVLIHDESPLAEGGQAKLPAACVTRHRSWVANLLPGATPFNEAPEAKIYFLGSQLGLSLHRKRQIEFLRKKFKDTFVASYDHTTPVNSRGELNRYKVGFCPEGRKFATQGMSATHTDRPFWCGCLGMVPVSENSSSGGRLEKLSSDGLIERYSHGDLDELVEACERALALTNVERRKIYDHFNENETIGTVLAEALAAAY